MEDGLPGAAKNTGDDARLCHTFNVMPGLDPGIHDETQYLKDLRRFAFVARRHGLPGQARQ